MKLYQSGQQGAYGDNVGEKPSIFDIVGVMKWNAWNEYKGIGKDFAKKMFIINTAKMYIDEGLEEWLLNKRRPGSSYYKDCKKWNWVDQLVDSHKKHLATNGATTIYGVELSDAEIVEMNKLNELNGAKTLALPAAILSMSAVCYTSLL
tara:strand:+ start:360 stop:806 length:447 start_codon:yes stop_codon:yes gene_type:complete